MIKYITPTDKSALLEEEIGGKAKNLFRLQELGMNVPKWMVIPQESLLALIPKKLQEAENNNLIIDHIENLWLGDAFHEEVKHYFNYSQNPNAYFAVRSSAVDEDGNEFSFAGQFESYLYVSYAELEEKIKKVWCSAFSERVSIYRNENKLSTKLSIAVIIQEMIHADASGVAFGINPATGDRKAHIISAVYGLGEGLVSGELNADNFIVKNRFIEKQLVTKEHAIVQNESGTGTKKIKLPADKYNSACLTDHQVLQISCILTKLTKAFGKPQDIEFAIAKNQVYLLQARPITNLNKVADSDGGLIVWDNSNIIESYPGVTTPLTFSFIIKLYEAVYKQFSSLMGVNDKIIEAENHTYANMLGLIQGRVYYNLLSWYKVLQLFPGYSVNAEFMEKMMGVKERFNLPQKNKMSKLQAYKSLVGMAAKMLKSLITLPKQRDQFLKDLDLTMKEYNAIPFEECKPDELMHHYYRLENTLLKKWKAPLINDFFAMIYYGTLQKLITKYNIQHNGNLHNDLLCGSQDIISTEPVHRLLEISTAILGVPEFKKLFLEQEPTSIWHELAKEKYHPVSTLINEYIHKFGERCVGELKLETISYKQEPTYLIGIIKSYVLQNITKRKTENNIEKELRKNAEASVEKALKGKPFKKAFFNYWLRVTRTLVSNRENLRYERTRAFGVARSIFTAMGKQFYAENIIQQPRDIFYLTKDEIFDFIKGTSATLDLKAIITIRKKEFELYHILSPTAERIRTNGMVYQGNNFYKAAYTQPELKADLKGIGCCPGQIRGKVKIVRNPNEVNTLNGDILVTASTDPGWVTLFPTASAIVVERGSLLSHSAIVSREMGIPCIVGVTGLLNTLETGDEIEMDGSTGQIKIITKHAERTVA